MVICSPRRMRAAMTLADSDVGSAGSSSNYEWSWFVTLSADEQKTDLDVGFYSIVPTATPTPTNTPTLTPAPTNTPTPTSTLTPLPTSTPTPTSTPIPSATKKINLHLHDTTSHAATPRPRLRHPAHRLDPHPTPHADAHAAHRSTPSATPTASPTLMPGKASLGDYVWNDLNQNGSRRRGNRG